MPTYSEVFDNNTDFINSVVYTAKKLEINFANELNASQAAAAILQSVHKYLVANTDLTVNLSASAPTRNTSVRNGVPKDQINFSIQVYTPLSSISFDPTLI